MTTKGKEFYKLKYKGKKIKYPYSEKRLKARLKRKLKKNKNYLKNLKQKIRRLEKNIGFKYKYRK